MVGTRVIMVWIYNNTLCSVFAVAAFHALLNLSAHALFPGSIFYEAQQIRSLLMVIIAILVTVGWGARTLTRRSRPVPGAAANISFTADSATPAESSLESR